jgi:predicted O-methyltransferase YrrM
MEELEKLELFIENKLNNYFSQQEALHEIKRIFPDLTFFPPSRGWAGSPDFLLKLVELVVTGSPKYIVEFGSGVSSIVLGAAMKKFSQGKVDSFDHHQDFSNNTNRIIEVNGLNDVVRINYSPLEKYIFHEHEWQWYDRIKVDNIESNIDLLIIDGPPRSIQKRSRFLALPILFDRLAETSVVVIDDSNREDEKEVIEEWNKFLRVKKVQFTVSAFEYFDKGMTIIKIIK